MDPTVNPRSRSLSRTSSSTVVSLKGGPEKCVILHAREGGPRVDSPFSMRSRVLGYLGTGKSP